MNTGRLDNAIDFNNVMMTDHQTVHHSRQSLADFSNSPQNESQRELLTNSKECRMFLDKVFSGKNLKRHMPIFQWLPVYNKTDFIGDLIAGITVSLAAIPLALAFAGIAGLPTEVNQTNKPRIVDGLVSTLSSRVYVNFQ